MFTVGDYVTFSLDGARGLVIKIDDEQCHVLWEDYFVSWERYELLSKKARD